MRGRCGLKIKKGGQMIKHSRWKGCKRVVAKVERGKIVELSQNNEMRWEIKRFERGKTGEDIRREGGEMDVMKSRVRKEVE